MVDQREDVISYIKEHDPVLPVQIAKHVDTKLKGQVTLKYI